MFTVDVKALSNYFGMVDLVNLGMPEAACELHTYMFCSKYIILSVHNALENINSEKIFINSTTLTIHYKIIYDLPKVLNINKLFINYRLYRPFINCRAFAISGAFVFFTIRVSNVKEKFILT